MGLFGFKKPRRFTPVDVEFTQEELDAIALDRETVLAGIRVTDPKVEQGVIAQSLANYSDGLVSDTEYGDYANSEISEMLDRAWKAKLKAYAVHNLPAFLFQAAVQLECIGQNDRAIKTYQLFLDAQRGFRPDKIDQLCLSQMGEKFLDPQRMIKLARERIELLTH